MITIQLNKRDFEYDTHSLVKAFFPEEEGFRHLRGGAGEGEEPPENLYFLWGKRDPDPFFPTGKGSFSEKKRKRSSMRRTERRPRTI